MHGRCTALTLAARRMLMYLPVPWCMLWRCSILRMQVSQTFPAMPVAAVLNFCSHNEGAEGRVCGMKMFKKLSCVAHDGVIIIELAQTHGPIYCHIWTFSLGQKMTGIHNFPCILFKIISGVFCRAECTWVECELECLGSAWLKYPLLEWACVCAWPISWCVCKRETIVWSLIH